MQVVRAVGGKIPVLIDGGVRRGTDIFKALALGAQAVLVNSDYEVLTLLTCQYVLLLFCKVLCFMLHHTVLYLIGTIMAGKIKLIVWKTIVAPLSVIWVLYLLLGPFLILFLLSHADWEANPLWIGSKGRIWGSTSH